MGKRNRLRFDKHTQRYFLSLFTLSQKEEREPGSMGHDTTQTRANQYQLAVFLHCKMPYRAIILLGSKDAVY